MNEKSSMTTDEEALAETMTILQRIADMALAGLKGDDEAGALSAINDLARNTIDALAERRRS